MGKTKHCDPVIVLGAYQYDGVKQGIRVTGEVSPGRAVRLFDQMVIECEEDTEHCHGEADSLFCFILRQHGYGGVVDKFEEMDKWWA